MILESRAELRHDVAVEAVDEDHAVRVAHRHGREPQLLAVDFHRHVDHALGPAGDRDTLGLEAWRAHVDGDGVGEAVEAGVDLYGLNAAEGFDTYGVAADEAVVVDIFCDATYAVAAHLGLGAVGIEYAHAAVGAIAGHDGYDTVGAYAGVSAADLAGEVGKIVERALHAVDIYEVVAEAVHLHEWYVGEL